MGKINQVCWLILEIREFHQDEAGESQFQSWSGLSRKVDGKVDK